MTEIESPRLNFGLMTRVPLIKTKTGLDSQGMTEKPGEFSNLAQQ